MEHHRGERGHAECVRARRTACGWPPVRLPKLRRLLCSHPRLRRAARQRGLKIALASDRPSCRYTHRDRIPHRGGNDGVSGRHSYRWWRDALVEAGSSRLPCTRPPERIGTTVASAVLAPSSGIRRTRPPSTCHGSTTGSHCPRRSEGMGFCWTNGHGARQNVARRDDLRGVTPAGDFSTRLDRTCTRQP